MAGKTTGNSRHTLGSNAFWRQIFAGKARNDFEYHVNSCSSLLRKTSKKCQLQWGTIAGSFTTASHKDGTVKEGGKCANDWPGNDPHNENGCWWFSSPLFVPPSFPLLWGGNMVTLMRSYCKGRNMATGSGPHQETFNKIRNFWKAKEVKSWWASKRSDKELPIVACYLVEDVILRNFGPLLTVWLSC